MYLIRPILYVWCFYSSQQASPITADSLATLATRLKTEPALLDTFLTHAMSMSTQMIPNRAQFLCSITCMFPEEYIACVKSLWKYTKNIKYKHRQILISYYAKVMRHNNNIITTLPLHQVEARKIAHYSAEKLYDRRDIYPVIYKSVWRVGKIGARFFNKVVGLSAWDKMHISCTFRKIQVRASDSEFVLS